MAESMTSSHSASQQTQQCCRWQISNGHMPASKWQFSFQKSRACLVTHRALPQADKLGNCSSITVVFFPTDISCSNVETQSWCLLGFSGSFVLSYSPEHGKGWIMIKTYGWKTKGRSASDFSVARTKMKSVVLITGFCFMFFYSLPQIGPL